MIITIITIIIKLYTYYFLCVAGISAEKYVKPSFLMVKIPYHYAQMVLYFWW